MFEELLASLEKSIKNLENLQKSRVNESPETRLLEAVEGKPINANRAVSIFRTGDDGILYSRNSERLQEPADWQSILGTKPHDQDEHEERGTGGLHSRYFNQWPRDDAGVFVDLRKPHRDRESFIDSMGSGVVARQDRARQAYEARIKAMRPSGDTEEETAETLTSKPVSPTTSTPTLGRWERRRLATQRRTEAKAEREKRSRALLEAVHRGASGDGGIGIDVSGQSIDTPETTKPETTKPETTKPETTKPEPVKPEPVKPETVKTESSPDRMRGTFDHPEALKIPGITPENYAGTRTGKDGKVEHLRWARSWELNFAETMSELLHKNIDSIFDDLSKSSSPKTRIVVKTQRGTR